MVYIAVCRMLGKYLFYLTAILLVPLGVAFLYDFFLEPQIHLPISATTAFSATLLICLALAGGLFWVGRNVSEDMLHRKGSILVVLLIWFVTAAIGSLPFLLTRVMENPVDAYFEAMSGLTTTGVTIIEPKAYDYISGEEIPIVRNNPLNPGVFYTFYGTVAPLRSAESGVILHEGIEALGKPLLFWRVFLQWIGGGGVVLLFITVLPTLAMGGRVLYESEAPGSTKEGIMPRIKESAGMLWKIYISLTALQVGLLLLTDRGMSLFEAVALSLATISTGGFTIYNGCFMGLLNPWTLGVIVLFMVLGGVNFSLYYYCLKRKFAMLWQPEFFYYLLSLLVGCLLVSWGFWNHSGQFLGRVVEAPSLGEALFYGSFQAISTQTSTGFLIISYDFWPFSSQAVMLMLMFVGGMSGSTAGGIKVIRFLIVWRVIYNKVEAFFRPEVVRILKVGKSEIPDKRAMAVLVFFCIVIFFVVLGTYLLVLDQNDPITALSVISTMINNNGLYFGGIGCTASLGFLSNFSKIVAILWMVLGRLEFFSLLVLLIPSFWRDR